MAHEITISKLGRAEMMYVGAPPWHGLGQALPAHATSKQAMQAAGLEWSVGIAPLYRKRADGTEVPVTEAIATVREDTDETLGVVTPSYRIIQNLEAFAFMDLLVGESAAMFETAGSLRGGRRVFACAKLPTHLVVGADDVLNQYLLFISGHDGGQAFHVRMTPIRVVCANTAAVALGRHTTRQISIEHTSNADVRMETVRRTLGISLKYFEVFGQQAQALSAKRLSERMAAEYFAKVAPVPTGDKVTTAQVQNAHVLQETFAYLFHEGRGSELRTAKGTAWGAFNAVTEWIDHVNPVSKRGEIKSNGFENALFGAGDTLRQHAWDTALALL